VPAAPPILDLSPGFIRATGLVGTGGPRSAMSMPARRYSGLGRVVIRRAFSMLMKRFPVGRCGLFQGARR